MSYTPLDKPESIAHVFVEAWARRDAEKLASLFDEDAEFVNVTGLWWHDRQAILNAHAYGFEHIFNAATLHLVRMKVKVVTDDVAVVHAKVRLDGQTAEPGGSQTATRNTILSFVVHRVAKRWSCVSAQNTDIVPNAETNVMDVVGTLRSVSYRR